MRNKNKGLRLVISAAIVMILVLELQVLYCQPINQADNPKIYINDKEINFTVNPRFIDGVIYAPMAQLIDGIGYYSEWDSEDNTAVLCSIDKEINIYINSKEALVNGDTVQLNAVPVILDNVVMVPVQTIAEKLGIEAKYDEKAFRLLIRADLIAEHYSKEQKEWALATAAFLNKMNGEPFGILGGGPKSQENILKNKNMLLNSWGVDDRESASETVEWLKSEGHRFEFRRFIIPLYRLSDAQYKAFLGSKSNQEFIDKLDYFYFHLNETENGDRLIDPGVLAWDYCRLVYMVGAAYNVGYLSNEEAWNEIMNAAQLIQKSYSSWKEMASSYAEGRYYWGGEERFLQCKKANDILLYTDRESPWIRLQWNLTLEGKAPSSKGTAENYDGQASLTDKVMKGLPGNSNGNIRNGGMAALKDDWIYYCGISGENYGLNKVKTDNSGRTKLGAENLYPENICVMDDWVFYTMDVTGMGGIYKISVDGSGNIKVVDGNIAYMNTKDGWIYYETMTKTGLSSYELAGPIFRIKPDGSGKTKLCEQSSEFAIVDDWIYYIESEGSGSLMRMKTDGSSKSLVFENEIFGFDIANDWIYFCNMSDNEKLYKVKNDGSSLTKVVDMPVSNINVVQDWIYFVDAKIDPNGGVLYKIKTDGTELTKIYRGTCRFINVAGPWIYFQEAENYSHCYRIKIDGTCKEEL